MKKKVIVAIILILIGILVFVLPEGIMKFVMPLAIAMIGALAYKETTTLEKSHHKYPDLMVALGLISTELMIFNNIGKNSLLLGPSLGIICFIIFILFIPAIFYDKDKYTTKEAFYLFATAMFFGLFFNLVMTTFFANKWLLLYLVLIATITDTFAMLIGCLIGKHKLIKRVSPNKSIEGSIAGSLLGTIIPTIYYVNVLDASNVILIVIVTLILSILAQLGDLLFSKIKRENEIKDFSNIIPGHGGILDRFDSLSFVVFGYVAILHFLSLF